MKIKCYKSKILYGLLITTLFGYCQTNYVTPTTADKSDWGGYMTWYGEGGNGDNWGVNDLKSTITNNSITLQPNFSIYANELNNSYWFDENGECNFDSLEASTFVTDNSLQGSDLVFNGYISSFTISDKYSVKAFIKVFDQDWNTLYENLLEISNTGSFSLEAPASDMSLGPNVQYGFIVRGPAGNPNEENTLGAVVAIDAPNQSELNSVTPFSANASDWAGYMTWLGEGGNGDNWGVNDLKSTITSGSITLQPNFSIYTNELNNSYWFDQNGVCNFESLEASTFITDNSLIGKNLVFSGNVESFTIDNQYYVESFVKVFNLTWDVVYSKAIELTETGIFSIEVSSSDLNLGSNIQYGFLVRGPAANPQNEDNLGRVVIAEPTASIEAENKASILFYPNPAENIIRLNNSAEQIKIYSLSGNIVKSVKNTKAIDVTHISKGLYLLEIDFRGNKFINKIIIN